MPIEDHWGNKLLYQSATGLEKSLADVESDILLGTRYDPVGETGLNAELIIDTWDPYHTFLRNLAFLAWAMAVDLWEDGWSETTQREWTARQWEFKTIRGTIDGIRMALDFVGRDFAESGGYELIQYLVPPQGFFVSPSLTEEEYNAWLRLMPEIRIYLGNDPGHGEWNEGFLDTALFTDVDAVATFDNGWELYGRKAILRQFGKPDRKLKVFQRRTITEDYQTVDWEEIRVEGLSNNGLFIGDFIESEYYLDANEIEAKTYSIRLDRTFTKEATEGFHTIVTVSEKPIDVRYRRNSDIGYSDSLLFVSSGSESSGFLSADFTGPNEAPIMLADYIYLLDESISVPMAAGLSFLDVDRLGFPKYTMELMVDLHTHETGSEMWIEEASWDDFFVFSTDLRHFDRACRAVVAAKALRDKALAAFDPLRPLQSADDMSAQTDVSDWVVNNL
jgi:Phage tail protein (Tail_P2_I)